MKIETARLILRPFVESDAAAASHNSKQPSVVHFMSDMVKDTEEAARDWIRHVNENLFDIRKPCVLLAIQLKSNDRVIGCVFVHIKPELNHELEIGYFIADEHQNNGYTTEAGKAIIWWTFEQAGQDMLSATVKPDNKASRRVIEKLGFVYVDTRMLPYDGADRAFDYFRLYHTDDLPGPEWDPRTLYPAERMSDFFKARAGEYNDYMLRNGDEAYRQLGEAFPETNAPIRILDLGCGSGIELDYIWARIPNAHVTCVDISKEMLALLIKNHPARTDQITAIEASYLDWEYPVSAFDFAVSSQTMHHFWPEQKTGIYRGIHNALRSGGYYIESDFYVDPLHMAQYQQRYKTVLSQAREQGKQEEREEQECAGKYHIDIPTTLDIQQQLLSVAGFQTVEVVESHIRLRWSGGIVKAGKQ
jgi:RimJ/RimL family protein N-acetyltransferase/ubiquinone/menaquinone biosynthesis C-methylase UbiE